jgi:hypothetical protein
LAIPIIANPALVDLLEWHCTQRTAYCAVRKTLQSPLQPHYGASHLTRMRATGKQLLLSPLGSSTLTLPSAPHLHKGSNGHRTASEKVPPPLLVASGPHSTSSNTWVTGPRIFR